MTSGGRSTLKPNPFVVITIAVVAFVFLLVTESDVGLTWDEPDYIAASESYITWFGELLPRPGYALSDRGIERYWTVNHEHPAMDKIWSGIVWTAARSILPDLTAHRLGNILLNSLSFGLLFLLVQDVYGRWVGLAASVSLFTMPRFFFYSHLAALDAVAASMIVATAVLFWKTREKSTWKVDIALGILWGAAVACKVNAAFLFPTLLLWALFFDRRARLLVRLAMMGSVALVVFFASWPWLYHHTIERTVDY